MEKFLDKNLYLGISKLRTIVFWLLAFLTIVTNSPALERPSVCKVASRIINSSSQGVSLSGTTTGGGDSISFSDRETNYGSRANLAPGSSLYFEFKMGVASTHGSASVDVESNACSLNFVLKADKDCRHVDITVDNPTGGYCKLSLVSNPQEIGVLIIDSK